MQNVKPMKKISASVFRFQDKNESFRNWERTGKGLRMKRIVLALCSCLNSVDSDVYSCLYVLAVVYYFFVLFLSFLYIVSCSMFPSLRIDL